MKIQYTRAMLNAALDGKLDTVEYETDPIFNLQVPKTCDGVPSEVLNPRNTWKDKKLTMIWRKNLQLCSLIT